MSRHSRLITEPISPRRRRTFAAAGALLLAGATAVGCAGKSASAPASGGLSPRPGTASAAVSDAGSASASAAAGTAGSATITDVEDTATQYGVSIDATVGGGFGCGPGTGLIYPSSITPGLTSADAPETGPLHQGKTWDEAPAAFGVVDPFPVTMTIDVGGTSDRQVTLTALTVHVLSREPKVSGIWLNVVGQCGSGGYYAYGDYDLDPPPPYLLPASALPSGEQQDAIRFPYTVTQSAGQDFYLIIDSQRCECSWDVELDWSDGTADRSFVIDDHGQPFQDSSTAGLKLTAWAPNFAAPSPSWIAETN